MKRRAETKQTEKLMNRSQIEFIVYLPILHLSQLCAQQTQLYGNPTVARSGGLCIHACDMWLDKTSDKFETRWIHIDVNARSSNN